MATTHRLIRWVLVPLATVFILNGDATAQQPLRIVSFNIQFLGHFKDKEHAALASVLAPYDIVIIQELVAPPYPGDFPDGDPFKPDPQAAEFFDAMTDLGFAYVLSEEDTGTGPANRKNNSATEWWVAFYKPETVNVTQSAPSGFLADDRSDHDDYERVPYAFAFEEQSGGVDFILISVHLRPGSNTADRNRRAQELGAIATWIDDHDTVEKDFIILGDMNIQTCVELADVMPAGYASLNDGCAPTNTTPSNPRPYDHVLYHETHTGPEIDLTFELEVIDLITLMQPIWEAVTDEPYPGDPYVHNEFRTHYSDHHPIEFRIQTGLPDDD